MTSWQLAETIAVPTLEGLVRGRVEDGTIAFRGIPYAVPPFGADRFALPRPPQGWTGVRDAAAFGPAAPQPATIPFVGGSLPVTAHAWGTDCLSLNVSTPEVGSANLPVMVYVHGGSYVWGSGADPRLDGAVFAREGVVCVTVNYRLGVDGFLHLREAMPNLGLHDQMAALRWVRRNIRLFGGDPGNVTVFGNSAGAGSIAAIASAAAAEGLFHRAILQSAPLPLIAEPDEARTLGARVLAELGIEDEGGAGDGGGVGRVPLPELMRRLPAMNDRFRDPELWHPYSYWLTPFMPAVDGVLVNTASPCDLIPASVGLLVGSTRDEGRFFVLPPGVLETAGPRQLRLAQEQHRLPAACVAASHDLYRDLTPGRHLAEEITDQVFRGPAVEVARAHSARGGDTYAYEFAWCADERVGALHALELPFLFDTLDDPATQALVGPDAPCGLGRMMRRSWVDFARTGDPGWARYDHGERRVMVFDTFADVARDPRERHRPAWDAAATSAETTPWVWTGTAS